MSSPRHAPAACALTCPHPRLRTTPQTIMMRRADQSLWQLAHTLLRHPPGQSSRVRMRPGAPQNSQVCSASTSARAIRLLSLSPLPDGPST